LKGIAATPAGRKVSQALGYAIRDDRCGAILFASSSLDLGASRWAEGLVRTTFPMVVAVSYPDGATDPDLVIVDSAGAKVVKTPRISASSVRSRLTKLTTPRDQLADADLDNMYSLRGGQWRRAQVKQAKAVDLPQTLEGPLSGGGLAERLSLSRRQDALQDDPPAIVSPNAQNVATGRNVYPASVSGIVGIDRQGPYAGGQAPAGFVWGSPTTIGSCSASTRDSCKNCCLAIFGIYGAAAGVAVSAGASAGAVPGLIVGAIIGAVLITIGGVHGLLCSNSCDRLYDSTTGDQLMNTRFNLTAAIVDDEGSRVGYKVEHPDIASEIIWAPGDVQALLWSGVQFAAVDAFGNIAGVGLVRKPKGGYYLRSSANGKPTDNLARLTEIPMA
jgi:hypothetical protein